MDQIKRMESIMQGFEAYEKVVDKEVHYVFLKNNKYTEIVFNPKKSNFMHLCGVTYKDFTAKRFYSALRNKKPFLPKDIKTKPDGTTDQKLQIIKHLNDLTTCKNLRIIDEQTTYLNFSFEKGIRSNRLIFCLALKKTASVFTPTSLLNLRSKKGSSLKNGCPVHCIYTVDAAKQLHVLCKTPEFNQFELTNTYQYVI